MREINPDMPEWLDAIVQKLHAKDPEDRFQSANEVADLLGQHLAHLQQPTIVPKPNPHRSEIEIQPRITLALLRTDHFVLRFLSNHFHVFA